MTSLGLTNDPTGPTGPTEPAGAASSRGRGDAFGTGATRWWRRLAGAGVVAMLATAYAAVTVDDFDRDGGFWALVVVATTYAGALLSWAVTGAARGGSVLVRHAGAGAGLGLVLAGVLTFAFDPGLWPLWVLICLPVGTLVGMAVAAVAWVMPRRVAPVVAVAGVGAVALLAFLTFRPLPTYDVFAVEATESVVAAGGAEGLAQRTVQALERVAGGGDLTSAQVWEAAGGEVSAGLSEAQPHLSFTRTQDLPVSKETGERVRLIAVQVGGEESLCMVVDPGAARVVDEACADLDLVR